MHRFPSRTARRTVGSALVGLALLIVAAVPTVAAAALPSVTPVCNFKAATIVAQPGATSVRGTQGPDVIVALERGVRIDFSPERGRARARRGAPPTKSDAARAQQRGAICRA